jgi:hypothetical protein
MPKWLVELEGDALDLEEFPQWFPDGEIVGVRNGSAFFLGGPAFDQQTEPAAVQTIAAQAIDELSAVILLLWPSFRRPVVGRVIRVADDGTWMSQHASPGGSAVVRTKAQAVANATGGGEVTQPTETRAQTFWKAAKGDRNLSSAMLLWSEPAKSWPRLDRVLEAIEAHLDRRVDAFGLCSEADRGRFTQSANVADFSGKGSRHAFDMLRASPTPMSLGEATELIRRLLEKVLCARP